jgi:hypothetical protein
MVVKNDDLTSKTTYKLQPARGHAIMDVPRRRNRNSWEWRSNTAQHEEPWPDGISPEVHAAVMNGMAEAVPPRHPRTQSVRAWKDGKPRTTRGHGVQKTRTQAARHPSQDDPRNPNHVSSENQNRRDRPRADTGREGSERGAASLTTQIHGTQNGCAPPMTTSMLEPRGRADDSGPDSTATSEGHKMGEKRATEKPPKTPEPHGRADGGGNEPHKG